MRIFSHRFGARSFAPSAGRCSSDSVSTRAPVASTSLSQSNSMKLMGEHDLNLDTGLSAMVGLGALLSPFPFDSATVCLNCWGKPANLPSGAQRSVVPALRNANTCRTVSMAASTIEMVLNEREWEGGMSEASLGMMRRSTVDVSAQLRDVKNTMSQMRRDQGCLFGEWLLTL